VEALHVLEIEPHSLYSHHLLSKAISLNIGGSLMHGCELEPCTKHGASRPSPQLLGLDEAPILAPQGPDTALQLPLADSEQVVPA
jgi:hypothetical protein